MMDIKIKLKNLLSALIFLISAILTVIVVVAPLCIIYGLVSEQLESYGFNYGAMLYGSGGIAYLVFVLLYVCRTKYRPQLQAVTTWKKHGVQIMLALAAGMLCKATVYAVSCRISPDMVIKVWREYDSLQAYLTTHLKPEPVVTFLFVVIIGPITEELLCRFHLGQHFEQDFSPPFTAVLSAFIFAMLHFDTTALGFITHLITGLFLYLLYCKTSSLLCAIAAHMGMNIYIDVCSDFNISSFVTSIPYTIITSCLMIAVVALLIFCPNRLPFRMESSESPADSFTSKNNEGDT
ncbi:MAG: CPBP family intramembrane metalloprotease [Oscillospiraceae bacterium]|nr:CPBP family intramembrane metalloprotease [Oscillospiraceae bacterium]